MGISPVLTSPFHVWTGLILDTGDIFGVGSSSTYLASAVHILPPMNIYAIVNCAYKGTGSISNPTQGSHQTLQKEIGTTYNSLIIVIITKDS